MAEQEIYVEVIQCGPCGYIFSQKPKRTWRFGERANEFNSPACKRELVEYLDWPEWMVEQRKKKDEE